MPITNKHFVGNLPTLQLSAILLSTVTVGGTFGTTGTVTNWPDGTGTRSFVVGIGTYGQTGYEEILCSLRGANVFTVEQRGYDNTSVVQHASGDPVTLVVDGGTIDAHELYIFQNMRRDVFANRGSAATYVDTTFYASDVKVLYRSDGTNWLPVGMASGVYTTTQRDALVAAEVYAGRIIYNSTTTQLEVYDGTSWLGLQTIRTFTTTQRDALASGQLWTGRVIYNSTTTRLEAYDGTGWVPQANLSLKGYSEVLSTNAGATGAMTVDLLNGNNIKWTLTGNVSGITFSNMPASRVISLAFVLVQDATGSRTVAWGASVKWPGGSTPTLSTGVNKVDVVSLLSFDGGTTWYGFLGGLDLR